MKILLMAIVFSIMPSFTSANAIEPDHAHKQCDGLSAVAQKIMTLRQNEESFQNTLYRARESDKLRLVVIDAYTVPVFFWPNDKKREAIKFGEHWYKKCMRSYQEAPIDIWDR